MGTPLLSQKASCASYSASAAETSSSRPPPSAQKNVMFPAVLRVSSKSFEQVEGLYGHTAAVPEALMRLTYCSRDIDWQGRALCAKQEGEALLPF